MSVRSLAVVGHVGPDVREGAMDSSHALAALAALGQPTRLSIFRVLVRNEPRDFRQALWPKLSAVRTIRFPLTSPFSPVRDW